MTVAPRSAGRFSTVAVVGLCLATALVYDDVARALALAGSVVCLVAVGLRYRWLLRIGALGLLVPVGIGATSDASGLLTMIGALLAVLIWDVGEYGITLREQLHRDADSIRAEVAHFAASGTLGAFVVTLGFGARVVVGTGNSADAVGVIVLAVVLIAIVFRTTPIER